MSSEEISEFLHNLELCNVCILRYTNKLNFNPIENNPETIFSENDKSKKKRSNICVACLGMFQGMNLVADDIINNSDLPSYDSKSIYSSISIPIALLVRDLSIWIALIQRFPGRIDCGKNISIYDGIPIIPINQLYEINLNFFTYSLFLVTPPNISIKDAFKQIFNDMLCKKTNRIMELHQNGILVNLFYDYQFEQEEIARLLALKPVSLNNISGDRKLTHRNMSRNFFEKHYFPSNLDLDACKVYLQVPTTKPVILARYSIQGPNTYLGGRYRKLSRDLSQTPWVLNGKRMKDDSVQEIICKEVCPYFELDPEEQNEKVTFIGSGREDVDVRSKSFISLFIVRKQNIFKLLISFIYSKQVRCLGKGHKNYSLSLMK